MEIICTILILFKACITVSIMYGFILTDLAPKAM